MDATGLIPLLERGGPVIWAIAALSLFTLTLIIWKTLRLARLGVWGGSAAQAMVETFRMSGRDPGRWSSRAGGAPRDQLRPRSRA